MESNIVAKIINKKTMIIIFLLWGVMISAERSETSSPISFITTLSSEMCKFL